MRVRASARMASHARATSARMRDWSSASVASAYSRVDGTRGSGSVTVGDREAISRSSSSPVPLSSIWPAYARCSARRWSRPARSVCPRDRRRRHPASARMISPRQRLSPRSRSCPAHRPRSRRRSRRLPSRRHRDSSRDTNRHSTRIESTNRTSSPARDASGRAASGRRARVNYFPTNRRGFTPRSTARDRVARRKVMPRRLQ